MNATLCRSIERAEANKTGALEQIALSNVVVIAL